MFWPRNVTDRIQPGVVYTTFHFPECGSNVLTTDNTDWATDCPEYKVTAVQVRKVTGTASPWQRDWTTFEQRQDELLNARLPQAAHAGA